jgi:N6-L-threonylcarbamoyladenine synthase
VTSARVTRPLLAIETSCDETAAAILDVNGRVLANVVSTQIDAHAPYGGVVPEIASREHLVRLDGIVDAALSEAGLRPDELGAVAATYGPGLIGALLVGLTYAKGMASGLSVPFIGVHHIEGHLMAASVDDEAPSPPFIGLVVSGGHSALYRYEGPGRATLIGETRDDAAGEAFDKTAKLLGLGYPGGALIDKLADAGDPNRFKLPISLRAHTTYDYSFSGLKTAVRLLIEKLQREGPVDGQVLNDVAASLRKAIVDALLQKAMLACRRTNTMTLVLGGGVAANSLLRREAVARGSENDVKVYVPPRHLCTDNAAMIAAAGLAHLRAGRESPLTLRADPGASVVDIVRAMG